ncbi:hypothetical protein [Sideroxydans lithotrophicus]|uniref:hypothetical protein n=1 Tax=Sideroxydans lithotrophicus TaxID=63745 RepID=UPI0001B11294|nr:hypothetical protein [Sideroxydans lithotrophicus]
MSNKQIKIISDGTPQGMKVFDVDGNRITGCITAIEWHVDACGGAEAKITFPNPEVELIGKVTNG